MQVTGVMSNSSVCSSGSRPGSSSHSARCMTVGQSKRPPRRQSGAHSRRNTSPYRCLSGHPRHSRPSSRERPVASTSQPPLIVPRETGANRRRWDRESCWTSCFVRPVRYRRNFGVSMCPYEHFASLLRPHLKGLIKRSFRSTPGQ